MSSPAQVQITTTPLYGVLVSRKSYLIGLHCLVRTNHAHMLAQKVGAGRLPTELTDLIAYELAQLECETVRLMWELEDSGRWGKGWIGKARRFRYWRDDKWDWTEAEKLAFAEVAQLNIDAVEVEVTRPRGGLHAQYMHLSARYPRPSMAMNLSYTKCKLLDQQPSGSMQTVLFREQPSNDVRMAAKCRPDALVQADGMSLGTEALSQESAVYVAKERQSKPAKRETVARLLELSDVEVAIQAWNQREVERFVELLQLKSVECDGGLKPALRLLQVVEDV